MIRWYKKKVELRQWLKASHQIRMQRRKQLPAKSDKKKLLQMLEDYKNVKIQTAKQKCFLINILKTVNVSQKIRKLKPEMCLLGLLNGVIHNIVKSSHSDTKTN